MPNQTPRLERSTTPLNNPIAPIALWSVIQLGFLGLGAARVPLWAHHPSPGEMLALPELWCGQIVFFAMLFPLLASFFGLLVINLCMMIPFAALAGLLSNTPQVEMLKGEFCVAIWTAGLGLWGLHRIERPVAAIAVLFSAGGAILDYVRWETRLSAGDDSPFHPLSLLPNLILHNWMLSFLEAAVPLLLGIIVLPFAKLATALPLSPTDVKSHYF